MRFPPFDYLPDGVDLFRYFDVIRFGYMLSGQYFLPPFTPKVLEGNDDEDLRERLSAQTEARYPADWASLARRMKEQQETILCTHMDGFFAYPRLQILDGIDKTEIARGTKAIDDELQRVLLAPLRRGGYCAALDHWVPLDISLQDYRCFVDRVRCFSA